jgi:hypothetical protein
MSINKGREVFFLCDPPFFSWDIDIYNVTNYETIRITTV